MRFSTVFTALIAVTVSSTAAIPLRSYQARDYNENALVARGDYLALRDVLQTIHARELAALDARALGFTSSPVRRSSGGGGHAPTNNAPANNAPANNAPANNAPANHTPAQQPAQQPAQADPPAYHPGTEQPPAYTPTASGGGNGPGAGGSRFVENFD
ncbi:hypothetical protein EIP91_009269 [Steccherinum ochraceum]|uniref:Uncharacterized protein n=1 Tax=Steccherinum ochraceum TaxID=92696 RepID=A0A4R0REV4_9APHY|nr:hypothetical protein EIP91_009269 [Steccherinum ochraceum]